MISKSNFQTCLCHHMETIASFEEFCQAITGLFDNAKNGLSNEDMQLLEYLKNSPDSLQFAIEEIDSEKSPNFNVLFESVKIVSNFIRNHWENFKQEEKELIINTLLNFITKSNDATAAVNKAIGCMAVIVSFEFSILEEIFQKIPDKFQLDFVIFLIEEMSILKETYDKNEKYELKLQYDEYLSLLCPTILQMLESVPLSVGFLRLSKAALLCFQSNALYEPFMDKFEEAINVPVYIPHCANFVRTILIAAPSNIDDPDIQFYFRIIKFSISLSFEYAKIDPDIPCEIWCEIIDFSPLLFFDDSEFAHFFLSNFFEFVEKIDHTRLEFHELVKRVCDVFTEEGVTTYVNELFRLFNIVLQILDEKWSNSFDIAVNNIYFKIKDVITPFLIEKMKNPTPGLFLIACQCRELPDEMLSQLSLNAIEMKDSLPIFHLLTFIWRVGIKYPEYKEQWLEILLCNFPNAPSMTANNLIRLLTKYRSLIPDIPKEFFECVLQYLEENAKSSTDIWIKVIKLFNIIDPKFSTSFLEKIHDFVINITIEVIDNENDSEKSNYFDFMKELAAEIKGKPNINEFKKSILDDVFSLFGQALSAQPEELEQSEDVMEFMKKLQSELEIDTDNETD